MNSRITLILAFVMVLFAVFYFWDSGKIQKEKKHSEEMSKVFTLTFDDIDGLSILRKDELLNFSRKRCVWEMTSPQEQPVSSERIETLLNVALTMKKEESKTDLTGELSEYGLKKPFIIVTVRAGEKEETLSLGRTDYTGYSYYARKDGLLKVFTVSNTGISDFLAPLDSYIENSAMLINPDDVTELEIKNDKGYFKAVKRNDIWSVLIGNIKWKAEQPVAFDIDSGKVADYLYALKAVRFQGKPAEKPKNASNGKYIKISGEACSDKLELLPLKGGDYLLTTSARNKTIALQDKKAAELFSVSFDAFKNNRILDIRPSLVFGMDIATPGAEVKLKRKRGVWLRKDDSFAQGANSLLWKLESLQKNEVLDSAKLASQGKVTITLRDGDDKTITSLAIDKYAKGYAVTINGIVYKSDARELYSMALGAVENK